MRTNNSMMAFDHQSVRVALQVAMVGNVHDQDAVPLPNVTIQAISARAQTVVTQSSSTGAYVLRPVSGTYMVTASLAGYGTLAYSGIAVSAGYTTTLNMQLTKLAILYFPLLFR